MNNWSLNEYPYIYNVYMTYAIYNIIKSNVSGTMIIDMILQSLGHITNVIKYSYEGFYIVSDKSSSPLTPYHMRTAYIFIINLANLFPELPFVNIFINP